MFANNAAVAQLPHSPRSEAEGGTISANQPGGAFADQHYQKR